MSKIIFIFLLIFCSHLTNAQTIDITGIGEFKIGMDTSELFNMLTDYERVDFEGIHYFTRNKQVHLLAWTYGNSQIRGLGTQNPEFKLANGIMVGSPIKEVLAKYPNAKLGQSIETNEEYLSISDEYEIVDGKKRTIILYVKSYDENELSTNDTGLEEVSEFSTDGTVTRIEVYNWN